VRIGVPTEVKADEYRVALTPAGARELVDRGHEVLVQAPTHEVGGVVHYCVANMPGAVPVTSTYALTNATMPYVIAFADRGRAALTDDPGFLAGLNVCSGRVTHDGVADALGIDAVRPREAIAA